VFEKQIAEVRENKAVEIVDEKLGANQRRTEELIAQKSEKFALMESRFELVE
jgi:hypothetical protein